MKFKSKKNLITLAVTLLLAVVVVVAAVCGHVYSKYSSSGDYTYNQISVDDFYFTVDILGDSVDAESSSREINLYGGTAQSITFSVRNYFDSLRITSSTIAYTVSYSSDLTSGSAFNSLTCGGSTVASGTAATFTADSGTQDTSYTLSISNFTAAETITVTIASSSPFTKTLTLKFNLVVAGSSVSCSLTKSSAYVELVLSTDVELTSGNVTLSWSGADDLQFDGTNSYFSLQSGNVKAVSKKKIDKDSSVSVKFFITDTSKSYTATVADSGGSYAITISETQSAG